MQNSNNLKSNINESLKNGQIYQIVDKKTGDAINILKSVNKDKAEAALSLVYDYYNKYHLKSSERSNKISYDDYTKKIIPYLPNSTSEIKISKESTINKSSMYQLASLDDIE